MNVTTELYDQHGIEIFAGDAIEYVDAYANEPSRRMHGHVEYYEKAHMWMVVLEDEPDELSNHWTPLYPPEKWRLVKI